MSRIGLTDTAISAIMKMSEGNPGAVTAMMDILDKHDEIDPQAMFGGLGAIMTLDTWEIYGSDIYVLWGDKCQRDVRKLLMVMRACQLGFLSHTKLQAMAGDQERLIDLTDDEYKDLDHKVCEQLKDFMKVESVSS